MKILELKSRLFNIKNSSEEQNDRIELEEESISKLEGRSVEIIWSEEERENVMKKNEQSLRECETHLKAPYSMMEVPEGKEKKKAIEKKYSNK